MLSGFIYVIARVRVSFLFKENILLYVYATYAKVRSQEKPGITGKFGPRVQNEVGQSQQFCQEKTLVIANTLFQQPKR